MDKMSVYGYNVWIIGKISVILPMDRYYVWIIGKISVHR